MTTSELTQVIPTDAPLQTLITPYLNAAGSRATCLSNFFPLVLTDTQSDTMMNGYLSRLNSNLSTQYDANKAAASVNWANLNINIITAVLELGKLQMNGDFVGTTAWTHLLSNDWPALSSDFMATYSSTNQSEYLHSAYLINSATTTYDKHQSISFLIDQSSTVGAANFASITTFLSNYLSTTNDDPSLISVNYYDLNLDQTVPFSASNTLDSIKTITQAHVCRCAGFSNLGVSINATITNIQAQNYSSGVPKLIVAVVGSTSTD